MGMGGEDREEADEEDSDLLFEARRKSLDAAPLPLLGEIEVPFAPNGAIEEDDVEEDEFPEEDPDEEEEDDELEEAFVRFIQRGSPSKSH